MKHSTASSPHISARPHSRAWTGTSGLGRSGYSVCSCPGSWARSSGCSSCRCPRILRLPIYTVNLLKIKTKMCSIIMYKCMFFFKFMIHVYLKLQNCSSIGKMWGVGIGSSPFFLLHSIDRVHSARTDCLDFFLVFCSLSERKKTPELYFCSYRFKK